MPSFQHFWHRERRLSCLHRSCFAFTTEIVLRLPRRLITFCLLVVMLIVGSAVLAGLFFSEESRPREVAGDGAAEPRGLEDLSMAMSSRRMNDTRGA